MAYNKFVSGNDVLLDLTDSTVSAETLASGETAYDKYGNKITGTLIAQGSSYDYMAGSVVASAGKTLAITGLEHSPKLIIIARQPGSKIAQLEPEIIIYDAVHNYETVFWTNTSTLHWLNSNGVSSVTDSSYSITFTNSFNFVAGVRYDYRIYY